MKTSDIAKYHRELDAKEVMKPLSVEEIKDIHESVDLESRDSDYFIRMLVRALASELYWRSAVMNEAESSDFHSGCVHCYATDSESHKPDCPYLLAQGYK